MILVRSIFAFVDSLLFPMCTVASLYPVPQPVGTYGDLYRITAKYSTLLVFVFLQERPIIETAEK